MWKPYLWVVSKMVGHAVHVLDRVHIMVQARALMASSCRSLASATAKGSRR